MTHWMLTEPKILVLDAPAAEGNPLHSALAKAGLSGARVTAASEDRAALQAQLGEAEVILTWRTDVDEAMIQAAPHALMILRLGPGVAPGAPRIDLATARRLGVYVSSIPDYDSQYWAGRAQALIQEHAPWPLKHKRLGLIGLGQVGRRVAAWAAGQGMQLWGNDPFAGQDVFDSFKVLRCELKDLMGACDVISLQVPLHRATRGMLGPGPLGLLKPSALLVSVSDPALMDLEALGQVFERGRPAHVALEAALPAGHPLAAHARFTCAAEPLQMPPHSVALCLERAGGLIAHLLQGNRPPHLLIDPPCPRHALVLAETL